VHFIRTHPALEASLFEQRFVAFWCGLDSPLKRFLEADSLGDRILLLANFFATAGTVAGVVMIWIRYRPYAFLLSAFPIIFPVMYYVTLPYLRYRQPIEPVLMLLAALALHGLLRRKGASATGCDDRTGL
jgi:predicted neutral ceramidase superfamily lipid hydrolase